MARRSKVDLFKSLPVVAWSADDLLCGALPHPPGASKAQLPKSTTPENWSVNGVGRGSAQPCQPRRGRPAGLRRHAGGHRRGRGDPGAEGPRLSRHLLSLHPDGMCLPDNELPDPYSNHAASTGQPAYPWPRTHHLLACDWGYAGSVDKSAIAGYRRSPPSSAMPQPSDFDVDEERVEWDGDPDDWGLRRMIRTTRISAPRPAGSTPS